MLPSFMFLRILVSTRSSFGRLGKIKKSNPSGLDPDRFDLDEASLKEMDLKDEVDKNLAKTMMLFPDTVHNSCRHNAPHLITQYLSRLAAEFHYFYNKHRILDDSKEEAVVDINRYTLILLVRIVLQNGLKLIGVSAPRKM